jgi:hypothetical protein
VKRSRTIRIPLVTTLAAAAMAAGCGSHGTQGLQPVPQGWQTCVDRAQGTSVDRAYCDDEDTESSTPAPGTSAASGFVPHYSWYYFPRTYYWDAPLIGSRVPLGGMYGAHPFSAAPMARTGGVVRGGFGTTASAHAASSAHATSGHGASAHGSSSGS